MTRYETAAGLLTDEHPECRDGIPLLVADDGRVLRGADEILIGGARLPAATWVDIFVGTRLAASYGCMFVPDNFPDDVIEAAKRFVATAPPAWPCHVAEAERDRAAYRAKRAAYFAKRQR